MEILLPCLKSLEAAAFVDKNLIPELLVILCFSGPATRKQEIQRSSIRSVPQLLLMTCANETLKPIYTDYFE